MCTEACLDFGIAQLQAEDIGGKSVLEVGAFNVNGSLRPLVEAFSPAKYVGVDLVLGPCVDLICDSNHLLDHFGYETFDVLICTEMLEHVRDWKRVISNFKHVLKPEGIMLITTRSKGFGYHSYPADFWRYELEDVTAIFSDFKIEALVSDPNDPGVFFKARKPTNFKETDLSNYALFSMVKGKRVITLSEEEIAQFNTMLDECGLLEGINMLERSGTEAAQRHQAEENQLKGELISLYTEIDKLQTERELWQLSLNLREWLKKFPAQNPVLVISPLTANQNDAEDVPSEFLKTIPVGIPLVVVKKTPEISFQRTKNVSYICLTAPLNALNLVFDSSSPRDVILCQKNVVLPENWLARLQAAAYSRSNAATATPLSNDGAFLTVRNDKLTLAEADRRIKETSLKLKPLIPTALPYCVYFRRTALNIAGRKFDLSLADDYSQLADFSQGLAQLGFVHLVADDLFVYHRQPPTENVALELDTRYPWYTSWLEESYNSSSYQPLGRVLEKARVALTGYRFVIEMSFIVGHKTGIEVLTLELVRALALAPNRSAFLAILINDEVPLEALLGVDKLVDQVIRISELGELEKSIGSPVFDLVHRPVQVFALEEATLLYRLAKRVVLTHLDSIGFSIPAYHPTTSSWLQHREIDHLLFNSADGIFFLSRSVMEDAEQQGLHIPDERKCLAYLGVDHPLHTVSPTPPEKVEQLQASPFILVIGNNYRHKNRPYAIRLFRELVEGYQWPGQLVLIGPHIDLGGSANEEALEIQQYPEIAGRITNLGMVEDSQKQWLLEKAALLLYPSIWEGFGMVPFEAAAVGTPALTTRSTSLEEVLGESVLYLETLDVADDVEMVWQLLSQPEIAKKQVEAIRSSATKFSWKNVAEKTWQFYEQLLATLPRQATINPVEGLFEKARSANLEQPTSFDYTNIPAYYAWIEANEPKSRELFDQQEASAYLTYRPLISIVTPVYNPPIEVLVLTINSVLQQTYSNWEFCLVEAASSNPAIRAMLTELAQQEPRVKVIFLGQNRGISGNSNVALDKATGEFMALLDQSDTLAPNALYENVLLLNRYPKADLIYSDEDRLDQAGVRHLPFFKPAWSPDLFRSMMYTCHLGIYRASLVREIGGFRSELDEAQDWDLVLRLTERTSQIYHIPKILYHWRMLGNSNTQNYETAQVKAVTEHCQRLGWQAKVEPGLWENTVHVNLSLSSEPKVSIIIPTRDYSDILQQCIESVLARSTYRNFEILVVDNDSVQPDTFNYFESLSQHSNIRILSSSGEFNYSAINNFAASKAEGEVLLFLNNDTAVISPNWLEEMLGHAMRPEVGAVGAKLLYPNGLIQHAGVILGLEGYTGHSHRFLPGEAPGYFARALVTQNFSAVTGACMMSRAEVFQSVGGFDEKNLKVAYNDVDYCLKLREKGLLIVWTPYATMFHYESLSRGYDFSNQEKDYVHQRWNTLMQNDPYYNPNLSMDLADFSIAKTPRSLRRK